MDQERKGEMKGIMRKCHGKGDKINSHEKIEKKKYRTVLQYKKLFFPRRDRESREHKHGEKREHRC